MKSKKKIRGGNPHPQVARNSRKEVGGIKKPEPHDFSNYRKYHEEQKRYCRAVHSVVNTFTPSKTPSIQVPDRHKDVAERHVENMICYFKDDEEENKETKA